MSWGGFKKSIARTGTTIMQKTGQVERTVDSEFADVEARYRALEKEVLALQKEAKAYLDAVRCESDEHVTAWENGAERVQQGDRCCCYVLPCVPTRAR